MAKGLNKETPKSLPNKSLVLVATFNKEMTDRPLVDIEDLLAGEAAPPA